MSTNPAQSQVEEPNVAGVKVKPGLALGLYGLLAVSAGVALYSQRNEGAVPEVVSRAAPWVFLLFAVGFAAYRFALVAARRYPAFKAFFQVSVMAVFFMLLVRGPDAAQVPAAPPVPVAAEPVAVLLGDADAKVRALAAEMARYRPATASVRSALVTALDDADATVKDQAHQSLIQLNQGRDLGTAATDWKEFTR